MMSTDRIAYYRERFTERSDGVVHVSPEEAAELNHFYIPKEVASEGWWHNAKVFNAR